MDYKKEPIKGYEEYSVDTNGVVYSKKGRPLKPSLNHNGYQIVNFMVNHQRKGFAIHTLVANQFLDKPSGKTQVNHIDGNKQNNNAENLEWVTQSENAIHSVYVLGNLWGDNNPGATPVIGRDIKTNDIKYEAGSIISAARMIATDRNVSPRSIQGTIWRAMSGLRKSAYHCVWEYK